MSSVHSWPGSVNSRDRLTIGSLRPRGFTLVFKNVKYQECFSALQGHLKFFMSSYRTLIFAGFDDAENFLSNLSKESDTRMYGSS